MTQKILIVLLVLSAGFAISGVSAVVAKELKSDPEVVAVAEMALESSKREVQLEILKENEILIVEEEPEPEAEEKDEVVKEVTKVRSVTKTEDKVAKEDKPTPPITKGDVFTVPFYSQFTDITPANWRKVGCGIASLAMLVDFYTDEAVSVDHLLQRGINAGAYLDNAGWIHSGLIGLSRVYGLDGNSRSMSHLSMTDAFAELSEVVAEGPVMVSVHYTFEPTNPIPHLVVVNGVEDGKVFYNDPSEASGGGSLSIEKFKNAWKKRYIMIRPV